MPTTLSSPRRSSSVSRSKASPWSKIGSPGSFSFRPRHVVIEPIIVSSLKFTPSFWDRGALGVVAERML
jgi:hypothetical protein